MRRILAILCLVCCAPGLAAAEQLRTIQDESTFREIVIGKKLTRLGIRLAVTPSGQILGRAFGKPVTGNWRWRGGFFCRDLFHGERELGANCQMVKAHGDTVRFISDRGAGIYADFAIR